MPIPPPGSHGSCLTTAVFVSLAVGALVALVQIALQHI